MSNDAINKTDKLFLVHRLLVSKPEGYSRQALSQLCGVSSRTISRYLGALQAEPYRLPLDRDRGPPYRWFIMPGARVTLPPVNFDLEDAVALTIAARLLSRYADERNQHLIDALSKLVTILPEAPTPHIQRIIDSLAQRKANPTFDRVFEAVVTAWTTRRVVAIDYFSNSAGRVKTYYLSPYLIEPSVVGHSTYVLGPCKGDARLYVTLKLERALDAVVTDEPYQIPSNFDGVALLNTAWEIMYQTPGEELVEVKLRFIPAVTPRVRESYWHPSQKIEDDPDNEGGCIFRVWIAHVLEIVPWVRQWGPQVEVIAPPDLRERIAREMKEAAAVYRE